jgi:hypothetical protein
MPTRIGPATISVLAGTTKYLPPTDLNNSDETIWVPEEGKSIRLKRYQVSVNSDTRIELRWGDTAFESFFMSANSSVIANLIAGIEKGPVGVELNIYSESAAKVTAKVSGDEE